MSHTLRYSSSRREVWHWYWRTWRARLWRIHAAIAVAVGVIMAGKSGATGNLGPIAVTIAATFAGVVAVSVAIPQILFKSSERTLRVHASGWSTQIGPKSGQGSWPEIAPVQEVEGAVILANKGGNALIVPARAFSCDAERNQFLSDVRKWQANAG